MATWSLFNKAFDFCEFEVVWHAQACQYEWGFEVPRAAEGVARGFEEVELGGRVAFFVVLGEFSDL